MFPCQTCNQLVSFCKKLITASANRSPKSSEVLSSQKKNDKNIFFFLSDVFAYCFLCFAVVQAGEEMV